MRPKHAWLAGAGLALAAAALAQDRPESILPPGFDEPATPTPTPTPSPTPAPAGDTAASPAAGAQPAARRSESATLSLEDLLAGVDGELAEGATARVQPELPPGSARDARRAGVLSPASIGMGEQPWGRAGSEFLQILMRRMDTPLASRWAHIGLRNLALVQAAPPAGVHPADWAAERAWLLLRMGEADAARLVVASVDVADFTPKMSQVAVQSALASSDPSALCVLNGRLDKSEPRIAPLVGAICASLSGDGEAAASEVEKVRRRGRLGGVDLALAGKLVGAGADSSRATQVDWDGVEGLSSWRYGLSTATGLMPPGALFDRSPRRVSAWLARAPMIAPADRLPAARVAAGLGVFSNAAMVDFYSLIYDQTDPDALGDSDAWQLRLAYVGKDADTRVAAMRKLWDSAKGPLDQEAMRVTTARAATRVAPSAEWEGEAAQLVASMLAAGFDRQAARWAAVVDDFDDATADRVWAMLALGAPTTAGLDLSPDRIRAFIDRDDSAGQHRSRLLVGGLAGLGRISPQVAGELNREARLGLSGTTLWTRLIDGAAARRQAGTAMLLAASAMQGGSFKAVQGMYLFHAVNGLRRNGQDYLARMIAAEALART